MGIISYIEIILTVISIVVLFGYYAYTKQNPVEINCLCREPDGYTKCIPGTHPKDEECKIQKDKYNNFKELIGTASNIVTDLAKKIPIRLVMNDIQIEDIPNNDPLIPNIPKAQIPKPQVNMKCKAGMSVGCTDGFTIWLDGRCRKTTSKGNCNAGYSKAMDPQNLLLAPNAPKDHCVKTKTKLTLGKCPDGYNKQTELTCYKEDGSGSCPVGFEKSRNPKHLVNAPLVGKDMCIQSYNKVGTTGCDPGFTDMGAYCVKTAEAKCDFGEKIAGQCVDVKSKVNVNIKQSCPPGFTEKVGIGCVKEDGHSCPPGLKYKAGVCEDTKSKLDVKPCPNGYIGTNINGIMYCRKSKYSCNVENGEIYGPNTDKCWQIKPPEGINSSCPPGYTGNGLPGVNLVCTKNNGSVCGSGFTYVPGENKCRKVQSKVQVKLGYSSKCPAGFTDAGVVCTKNTWNSCKTRTPRVKIVNGGCAGIGPFRRCWGDKWAGGDCVGGWDSQTTSKIQVDLGYTTKCPNGTTEVAGVGCVTTQTPRTCDGNVDLDGVCRKRAAPQFSLKCPPGHTSSNVPFEFNGKAGMLMDKVPDTFCAKTRKATCPTGMKFDRITGECKDEIKVFKPKFKACPSGYTDLGGICTKMQPAKCPAGQIADPLTGKCYIIKSKINVGFDQSCPSGYTDNVGVCTKSKPIPCNNGYKYNILTDKCEKLQSKINITPKCKPGFTDGGVGCYKTNGKVRCPSGLTYDPVLDKCNDTKTLDFDVDFKFLCDDGWKEGGTGCYKDDGPIKCPPGEKYEPLAGECAKYRNFVSFN